MTVHALLLHQAAHGAIAVALLWLTVMLLFGLAGRR